MSAHLDSYPNLKASIQHFMADHVGTDGQWKNGLTDRYVTWKFDLLTRGSEAEGVVKERKVRRLRLKMAEEIAAGVWFVVGRAKPARRKPAPGTVTAKGRIRL